MGSRRGSNDARPSRPKRGFRRMVRTGAVLSDFGPGARLPWIMAAFLLVVAAIVGYNAQTMSKQKGDALTVNVAARQRALAERYVKDVLLQAQGYQADPAEDADMLQTNANALINGGAVQAVQGADGIVRIPSARKNTLVENKLEEERRLIGVLLATGDRLTQTSSTDPAFAARVQALRVVGGQVSSVSNDAVGQMTADAEASFAHLIAVGIVLGLLSAAIAVGMGLLLRRVGARQSAQFRSLVHNGSDLITVVDGEGSIRYQSPSAERLLGYRPGDLLGANWGEFLHPADVDRFRGLLGDLAEGPGETVSIECRVRHPDGSWRFVESIVTDLTAEPLVRGFVLNTRDVTERKTLEEELAHQAFHDSLTGLANRALFRDRVDHALTRAARHGLQLAVLLVDLDGFKLVNDSLGHDAGDELLIAVAERMQGCARASDTVARLGGDEFVVLLEDDMDVRAAVLVAERVIADLGAPFTIRGRELFVGGSVGIALSNGNRYETDELVHNADAAGYAAKALGRGRYEVFRPDMHERAVRHLEVEADLRRAVSGRELVLHYQPIVNLHNGAVNGIEALVRWQHPTRGLLMPADFIHLAEETGLIVPIGLWVLREACRQTAEWRARRRQAAEMWVSVNVSTRQLVEPDVVDHVGRILNETGFPPHALTLEITEGTLMQGVEETILKLRGLKDLGVRLAIDDFGTGASSLGYLRQFPIDVLKIDKSFVDDLPTGPEGPALVEAIVELARTLRLETVAEGIELADQLVGLQSAGCRSGQGFLFARPLDPRAMETFLDRTDRSAVA
jgi:diguanylate cyclase (GGDEF)-like protein/PAS domain S-box-containing protein